jgi:hypothetical protein
MMPPPPMETFQGNGPWGPFLALLPYFALLAGLDDKFGKIALRIGSVMTDQTTTFSQKWLAVIKQRSLLSPLDPNYKDVCENVDLLTEYNNNVADYLKELGLLNAGAGHCFVDLEAFKTGRTFLRMHDYFCGSLPPPVQAHLENAMYISGGFMFAVDSAIQLPDDVVNSNRLFQCIVDAKSKPPPYLRISVIEGTPVLVYNTDDNPEIVCSCNACAFAMCTVTIDGVVCPAVCSGVGVESGGCTGMLRTDCECGKPRYFNRATAKSALLCKDCDKEKAADREADIIARNLLRQRRGSANSHASSRASSCASSVESSPAGRRTSPTFADFVGSPRRKKTPKHLKKIGDAAEKREAALAELHAAALRQGPSLKTAAALVDAESRVALDLAAAAKQLNLGPIAESFEDSQRVD